MAQKKQKNFLPTGRQASTIPVCKPNKIRHDLQDNLNWRIFRILAEFIEGFQFLLELKKEVTIFGSARFIAGRHPGDHHYKEAYKLGKMLGERGFTIVTGGGPGIMEAANKGASEVGATSVGLNIQLPIEQRKNMYVQKGIGFHYFFTRKVMLSASAQAYIFLPGGFGTLDEFFEIITLIQTGKMDRIPVVLIGKDFWRPLIDWIEIHLYKKHRTISKEDMQLYQLVNTVDEAVEIISHTEERDFS